MSGLVLFGVVVLLFFTATQSNPILSAVGKARQSARRAIKASVGAPVVSAKYFPISPYRVCHTSIDHDKVIGVSQPAHPGINSVHILEYFNGRKTIFKPEEQTHAYSVFSLPMTKRFLQAGKCIYNERAAYLFDHSLNLGANVPRTEISTKLDGKLGSEQDYVPDTCPLNAFAEKYEGHTVYDSILSKASLRQFQALNILDICLANFDRHDRNILIAGNNLVPIDHGFILIDFNFLDEPSYNPCYYFSDIMSEPLLPELVDKVNSMHVPSVMKLLLGNNISPESVMTLFVKAELLKHTVGRGGSLVHAVNLEQQIFYGGSKYRKWVESFDQSILTDRETMESFLSNPVKYEELRITFLRNLKLI